MYDDEEAWYRNQRSRDWAMLIPGGVLFGVVWHLSSREKAVASAGSFLLLYVMLSQFWGHRRERWFWISMSILAAIHISAICLVPFRLPAGPAISYVLPIALADGFAMFGLLRWLASKLSSSTQLANIQSSNS